ncbi:MAP kinase [Lentinula raphanica]|nr:MAP kinase [Lentinula raphanica]
MSEAVRGRRIFHVTNRGSDSESSDEETPTRHIQSPPLLPKPNHPAPSPLTTNIPIRASTDKPPHSTSSPSSASSPAAEETPPPSTPGVSGPSIDITAEDPTFAPSSSPYDPLTHRPHPKFNIFKPFNSGSNKHTRSSSKRPSTSPTVSTPDERILILVTADSERYVNVDITSAKSPAAIREFVFTKLHIYDEEDQARFSIYQTEIGAYATSEALTDERLYELCKKLGDSRGSLKLLVSHSSARVHEQPLQHVRPLPPVSPPTVVTIPPPVLPQTQSLQPLRPKRRSSSRRDGSISSTSEQIPTDSPGYDADLDNADRDNRSTMRPPTQQMLTTIASAVPPSPISSRRSGAPLPSRPTSPPPPTPTPMIDRYGNMLPTPPPPPPLSPNRATFPINNDNSLTPPARHHTRSGSDAASDRERLLQNAHQSHGNKQDFPAAHGERRRQRSDQDERSSNPDSWVFIQRPEPESQSFSHPQPSTPPPSQEHTRHSPSKSSKAMRSHVSPTRYNQSNSKGFRIPPVPRGTPPVPSPSVDSRLSQPVRTAGQPVPHSWAVNWKGESKNSAETKPLPSTSSQWRNLKSAKSMDSLRAVFNTASPTVNHPHNLRPGKSGSNASSSSARTNSNASFIPSPSYKEGSPIQSLSKPVRPLPIHGGGSQDFPSSSSHSRQSPYNVISPSLSSALSPEDPYPRPRSALGDSVFPKRQNQAQSATPGTEGSNFNLWPHHRPMSPTSGHSKSAGLQRSGSQTRTPPRSPSSPHSPRSSSKRLSDGFSPFQPDSGTAISNGSGGSDATLRRDEHPWLTNLFDEMNRIGNDSGGEATLMPQPRQLPDPTSASSTSTTSISPPRMSSSPSKRPPLTVQIENIAGVVKPLSVPSGGPSSTSGASAHGISVPPQSSSTATPNRQPSFVESTKEGANSTVKGNKNRDARQSTFLAASDSEGWWAPRPPPEDMYEKLDQYFPEHDLDKPVIEAASGGTSPTNITADIGLGPGVPPRDHSRIRAKKSIRIVAQEHKKRIDRTSMASHLAPQSDVDTISQNSKHASDMARKRSTKLWGSKLEEVTTENERFTRSNSGAPESPSGSGPTTFKWVRGELIGRGTYGRVYLALNATTGEMMAVKQVDIPQTASDKNDSRQATVVQALKSESETLKDLDHPNIVQYLGFEETPSNLSIFLEYVPGGSIGSVLLKHGKFREDVTKSFTGQILSGLEYLHSKGILHRDLKADNILVEMSGVCKISDFGISKRTAEQALGGGAATAMQGTVFWMAPEVINPQGKVYNSKIDIWSVGCVVLEMWAGMRPWNGDEMVAVMFKLASSKSPPPVPEGLILSELADDFRRKCFAINPDDRPSATELRKHRYLELPPGWTFTGFT